ncbi:MAG: hypothetical protein ACREJX_04230, partial [Polyangiaceae bacterium]
MKTRNTPRPKRTEEELRVIEHEAGGAAAGAIIGATAGAIAGPPGSVAGAILGGLAGGLAATVIEREDKADSIRDQELDAAIGVSGGEMGAPNMKHPPAKV